MTISDVITNALPNTFYGAAGGFVAGTAIMAALDRFADKRPYLDFQLGAIPWAVSRAVAPYAILLGGVMCGSVGAVACFVHSVAQEIF